MRRAALGLSAVAGVALAAPAQAECLGNGCYDGLLTILILMALGAVLVLGLVIWLVVRLILRARARHRAAAAPPPLSRGDDGGVTK